MYNWFNSNRRIQLFVATALCLAVWNVPAGLNAKAGLLAEKTVMLEEDQLAVTVASASSTNSDPLESDLTIWVGEITLNGQNTIWVELIDDYGEVIYASQVAPNETHLLPDGRAIVARSVDPATRIVKTDETRVVNDSPLTVTRRVVDSGEQSTSVEFVEETRVRKKSSPLLEIAAIGNGIWEFIHSIYEGAAERIQIAWNWIVDTVRV